MEGGECQGSDSRGSSLVPKTSLTVSVTFSVTVMAKAAVPNQLDVAQLIDMYLRGILSSRVPSQAKDGAVLA